jgi:hypothetical protein
LTSGGSTAIPIFFASSMYSTSLSVLSRTDDISAAKYCSGKFALRYAV